LIHALEEQLAIVEPRGHVGGQRPIVHLKASLAGIARNFERPISLPEIGRPHRIPAIHRIYPIRVGQHHVVRHAATQMLAHLGDDFGPGRRLVDEVVDIRNSAGHHPLRAIAVPDKVVRDRANERKLVGHMSYVSMCAKPPGSQSMITDVSGSARPDTVLASARSRIKSARPRPLRPTEPTSRKLRREIGPEQSA